MDPVSAVAIIHGLARSLKSACTVLEDTAFRFTTESIGGNFREAMTTIRILPRDLGDVQKSLQTDRVHALLDSLSSSLDSIEIHLSILKENIQDMDSYGKKLAYQWQSRGAWTRDVEVAKSSILLAVNMVKMMKVVQRQMQEDRLHIARHTTTDGDEINGKNTPDTSIRPYGLIFTADNIVRI